MIHNYSLTVRFNRQNFYSHEFVTRVLFVLVELETVVEMTACVVSVITSSLFFNES